MWLLLTLNGTDSIGEHFFFSNQSINRPPWAVTMSNFLLLLLVWANTNVESEHRWVSWKFRHGTHWYCHATKCTDPLVRMMQLSGLFHLDQLLIFFSFIAFNWTASRGLIVMKLWPARFAVRLMEKNIDAPGEWWEAKSLPWWSHLSSYTCFLRPSN